MILPWIETGGFAEPWFYLRPRLEWLWACVLHCAKLCDYSAVANLPCQAQRNPDRSWPQAPIHINWKRIMKRVSATSTPSTLSLSSSKATLLLSTFGLALFLMTVPMAAQARNTFDSKTASTTGSTKTKGVRKVTYQRSSSEETRSERDRRMYRECKGMHNAGACRGYTR